MATAVTFQLSFETFTFQITTYITIYMMITY